MIITLPIRKISITHLLELFEDTMIYLRKWLPESELEIKIRKSKPEISRLTRTFNMAPFLKRTKLLADSPKSCYMTNNKKYRDLRTKGFIKELIWSHDPFIVSKAITIGSATITHIFPLNLSFSCVVYMLPCVLYVSCV